ncbi:hypothetical protein HDV03_001829 [Kappamyces sp. JEL0829]|nr:hypothetical protein HDV03_001829 [Kappamyces sp. JEL0829]
MDLVTKLASKSAPKLFGIAAYFYGLSTLSLSLIWVGGYDHYMPRWLQILIIPFHSIDGPLNKPTAISTQALTHNSVLLAVFVLTHSLMARPVFKQVVTRLLYNNEVERSIYVFVAALELHLLMALWKPLPQLIYVLPPPLSNLAFWGPVIGYASVVFASFNIDHFHLFGLTQSLGLAHDSSFRVTGLYRVVRHPIMTGLLVSYWFVPTMSVGRLLFNVVISSYIVVAVLYLEEKELVKEFGKKYENYMKTTPALWPNFGSSKKSQVHLKKNN